MKNNTITRNIIAVFITLITCFFVMRYVNDSFTKKIDYTSLAIVNEDGGQDDINLGMSFINSLQYDKSLNLMVTNRIDMDKGLSDGTYDIGLIIPNDFTRNSADVNSLIKKSELSYKYKNSAGIFETKEYDYQMASLDNNFNSNLSEVFLRNISKDVNKAQKQTIKNNKISSVLSKEVSGNNVLLKEDSKNTKSILDNLKNTQEYAKTMLDLSKAFFNNANSLNDKSEKTNSFAKELYNQSIKIENSTNNFSRDLSSLNNKFLNSDKEKFTKLNTDTINIIKEVENISDTISVSTFEVDFASFKSEMGKPTSLYSKNYTDLSTIINKPIYNNANDLSNKLKQTFFSEGIKKYVKDNETQSQTNVLIQNNLYRIKTVCLNLSAEIGDQALCQDQDVIDAQLPAGKNNPFITNILTVDDFNNYLLDTVGISYANLNSGSSVLSILQQDQANFQPDPSLEQKFETDLNAALNNEVAYKNNYTNLSSDISNIKQKIKLVLDSEKGFLAKINQYSSNATTQATYLENSTNKVLDLVINSVDSYENSFKTNSEKQSQIYKDKIKETQDLNVLKDQESDMLASVVATLKDTKNYNKDSISNLKSVTSENKALSKLINDFKGNVKTNDKTAEKYTKYIKSEKKFVTNFKTVLKNAKNGDGYNDEFFTNAKNPIAFNPSENASSDGLVYPAIMVFLISFASIIVVALNHNYHTKLEKGLMETLENFNKRMNIARLMNLLLITSIQAIIITFVTYSLFANEFNSVILWFLVVAICSYFMVILIDTLYQKFNKLGLIIFALFTIFYIIANDLVILSNKTSITNSIASLTPYGLIENLLKEMLFYNNIGLSLFILGIILSLIAVLYFLNTYSKTRGSVTYE